MNQSRNIHQENIEDIIALSPMQTGILFDCVKSLDQQSKYFEQLTIQIRGFLDYAVFQSAWEYVSDSNEMLRAIIKWAKMKTPVQVILKRMKPEIYYHDISSAPEERQRELLEEYKSAERQQGFELEHGPLFRVSLCKFAEDQFYLVMSYHHIILDGWSTGVILREFVFAYDQLLQGKMLPQVQKTRFKEYIRWMQEHGGEEAASFWQSYLADFTETTSLPYDRLPLHEGTEWQEYLTFFPAGVVEKAQAFCQEQKITLSALFYTAWGLLLERYSSAKDILFGTPVSGRPTGIPMIEEMVGLFINTLPLRIEVADDRVLLDVVLEVQKAIQMRQPFEHVALAEMKALTGIVRQSNMFDSLLVVENYPLELAGLSCSSFAVSGYEISEQPGYDLMVRITPFHQFELGLIYNSELFFRETIVQLANSMIEILKAIVTNPLSCVSAIDIVSEEDRQRLVYQLNQTEVEYSREKTIVELFENVVEEFPARIAVVYQDQELTYRELNEKANQLARVLRKQGIGRNSVVGVMSERSVEMILGVLAIVKAGGAYLPIEPDYPDPRIQYMLQDAGVQVVLVTKAPAHRNPDIQWLNLRNAQLFCEEGSNVEPCNRPEDLIYIIYTSGSTGIPKGVMIEHRNVNRLITNSNMLVIQPEDRILATGSLAFDASTFEIWGSLLNGATLYMIDKAELLSAERLREKVQGYAITMMWMTAPLFNQMVEENDRIFAPLHTLIIGGDVLSPKHVNQVRRKYQALKVINGYGPTESTTFATFFPIEQEYAANIPIGRPVANTQVYVLNRQKQLQPFGVPGELCIAGDGLARGYLNNPELTAEKFVDNPFRPGERMYRTGDLARVLREGVIDFIGRKDMQVKIRGFRVEPGEVEAKLLAYQNLKEAVVLVKEDEQKNKYLCAYLVPGSETFALAELKAYLHEMLPDYMVPASYVLLPQLPLNSNGKVDREALLQISSHIERSTGYVSPANEIEAQLANLWGELLGLEEISVEDDFFELGGHSLKAMTLAARIYKEMNVEVPITEILQKPTIRGIARYIRQARRSIFLAISPVEERDCYPLSMAQKRLYVLHQFDPLSLGYNMPSVWSVSGRVDVQRLQETLVKLIKRHEALRTSFSTVDGEPVQVIHPHLDFALTRQYLEGVTIEQAVQEFIRPFELGQAPLFRGGLLETDGARQWLVFDMHHIISDGVSMEILLQDSMRLYNGEDLSALRIQYKEVAVWQKELAEAGEYEEQILFWQEQLAQELPVLELPLDYPRPTVLEFSGASQSFRIDVDMSRDLQNLAKKEQATLHLILLAAYNAFLYRYTSQEDLIVGTPIASRVHADFEGVMGMFVNTLALRNRPKGEKRFIDFLREVKANALKAYQHQDIPLEELIARHGVERLVDRNPLFDTVFAMENFNLAAIQLEGLEIVRYPWANSTAKFDLTLLATEVNRGIELNFEYRRKLFAPDTIARMGRHFIQLIAEVVMNPEIRLQEIELMSAGEKEELLYQFNTTQAEYPTKTVHALIRERSQRCGETVAIVAPGERWTYGQIEERAEFLAQKLRKMGAKPDSVIGIFTGRTPEMVIAMLGVLKAGSAFLPIDLDYPMERVLYMLADSGAPICILGKGAEKPRHFAGEVLLLDEELSLEKKNREVLSDVNTPCDLAYVIYTSGSTGKPKGVMVEHKSLINLCHWHIKEFAITMHDRAAKYANFSFDASVWEVFPYMVAGATLYIIPEEIRLDVNRLNEYFEENGITCAFLPTQMCEEFMKVQNHSLRLLLTGGDRLRSYQKRAYTLVNNYGPTENTVVTTSFRVDTEYGNIPIGRPIANQQVFILGAGDRLQPIGVLGELCIGGTGLARGYLNQPELTAQKFTDNPWIKGARMYRTGDLARWKSDGCLEFVGRRDAQVKIRGYRIELAEVENCLAQHPAVQEAVVSDWVDADGLAYLAAYIVAKREWQVEELRNALRKELPEYMIPSYFLALAHLPLTPNGKVDRKALPEPVEGFRRSGEYVPPQGEIEIALAKIWEEVLQTERVGRNDNFFELGGHSLKATTLLGKIHQVLGIEIPLVEIFKAPIFSVMADYLQKARKSDLRAIAPVDKSDYYPVSSAQRRLYILHQLNPTSLAYNMPSVWEVHGQVDDVRLAQAVEKLIERHEALRSCFTMVDGEIVQRIEPLGKVTLEVLKTDHQRVEQLLREFVRPFDLTESPLLRIRRVQNGEGTFFFFDLHHIISDGISMGILMHDLMELYKGTELPALSLQYKDFAVWHNHLLKSESLRGQAKYWRSLFDGELPILNLPLDHIRPSTKDYAGERLDFAIDGAHYKGLQKIVRETGATMYMVLLAMYTLLLAKYSGQDDIIIGTPIAGRGHADLNQVVGVFINTLAMRNFPSREKEFRVFLHEVKENALQAYENQDYPFEELVESLHLQREWNRNPLFDVMFTMLNMDLPTFVTEGLALEPLMEAWGVAKFDLTLTARESGEGVNLTFQYAPELFARDTIERFSRHLVAIAEQVIEEQSITLSNISILSANEREQLLQEFNRTQKEFPCERTIVDLFLERVQKTPEKIALVAGENRWTFAEWNQKANQLANCLRQQGVGVGQVVAIFAERNIYFPLGVMAIQKAGAAYLPIEPDYPEERVAFMLRDSGCRLLLSSSEMADRITLADVQTLQLSDPRLYCGKADNPEEIKRQSEDMVYVIYTSGTTGKPKGVGIRQYNLVNYVAWFIEKAELVAEDRTAILSSLAFDLSYTAFFPGILRGCEIHLISRDLNVDPVRLVEYLSEAGITFVKLTPSLLHMLIQAPDFLEPGALNSLRLLICGGEEINPGDLAKLHATHPEVQVMNHYGPTETTIGAIAGKINFAQFSEFREMPTLGKPIANTRIYILDAGRNPVAIGVWGEIHIGGEGVALGYVHQPELTMERFIEVELIPGFKERVYKTGDLGRWLPDGRVQFLGRADQQVKIRGYRVEIGEVEECLENHPAIQQAVVLDRIDAGGEKYLCAYIVSDLAVTPGELREYLRDRLPDYMIPAYFLTVEQIPLTYNGKVNRSALPEPAGRVDLQVAYEAPGDLIEKKLVTIWQEVLGREQIGVNDNFFELGGHSLKATTLAGEIHKEMQVELPLKEIFKTPTIRGLARYLSKAGSGLYEPISQVECREYYPLSSAQKRIFVLQRFTENNLSYNMPTVWEIEGEVDTKRLSIAFNHLIQRHEVLRTGFEMIHGEPVQRVYAQLDFRLEERVSAEQSIEELSQEFMRPFDLACPPLLRVQLVSQKNRNYIFFDIHHIISDGVSNQILIRDLLTLYTGKELPEIRVQYKDYVEWENGLIQLGKRQKGEEYWLNQFAGEIPVLALPTDFARPAVRSFLGATLERKLNLLTTKRLLELGRRKGATLYMTLLAAYTLLLAKYSSQEDIIVGSPIAGRLHPDLHNTMGIFINTLAIRNRPLGIKSFEEYLEEVKANTLAAFEHQDCQFERLVEKLGLRRDLSRNPLFDTMFILQNTERYPVENGEFRLKQSQARHKTAKFDLTLSAMETAGGLELLYEYNTALFTGETIQRFARHMEVLLDEILANPEEKMGQYSLILPEEKALILGEWNDTQSEFAQDRLLYQWLEEEAIVRPDAIAIISGDQQITYRQLDEKTNQLARYLRHIGVKADQLVGIMVPRSVEMLYGIYAILKAGGAYLPIDPNYPSERIEYMLQDSQVTVLLTLPEHCLQGNFTGTIADLSKASLYAGDSSPLEPVANSKNLAYVIYTSGSTGNPKGVMIEHHSIVNRLQWMLRRYPMGHSDTFLLKTPFTFDVSVPEIFSWQMAGARLALLGPGDEKDPAKIVEAIDQWSITTIHFVPSMLTVFLAYLAGRSDLEKLRHLRYVSTSGEALQPKQVELFNQYLFETNGTRIYNLYGPTETTVEVTYYECPAKGAIALLPIGKSIANTRAYVVSPYGQLQPIGVPGELCMAGENVARGYLNRPELTAEKFVHYPFKPDERMYKTGDLVRWLADGNLEFLGRIDHQVKIRGFRVELGEIEYNLLQHDSLTEAVVLVEENGAGEKYLSAYVVSNREVNILELREYLSQRLPEYMIPAQFIQLAQMPLTHNGKLNKKMLKELGGKKLQLGVTYVAPEHELEISIADLWKTILQIEKVGIDDNFFDLGGSSLQIVQVGNQLQEMLGREIPVVTLFRYPTIRTLVQHLNEEREVMPALEQAPDRSEVLNEGKNRMKQRMQRRREA